MSEMSIEGSRSKLRAPEERNVYSKNVSIPNTCVLLWLRLTQSNVQTRSSVIYHRALTPDESVGQLQLGLRVVVGRFIARRDAQ